MEKQFLWLMHDLSKDPSFPKMATRATRSADKVVFKVPARILLEFESSPYCIGMKLWSDLGSFSRNLLSL